jgi:hypothetical protein
MLLKGVYVSFKEFWGFLPYWFRGFVIGVLFPIITLLLALILGFFLTFSGYIKYPYDFLVSIVWFPYSVLIGIEYGVISTAFTVFLVILISSISYGSIASIIGLIFQLIKFRSLSQPKSDLPNEDSKTNRRISKKSKTPAKNKKK